MNPLFPPIIRGIQDAAEAVGYTVITANTDDEEQKEADALRMMQGRSIEGVIITTARRQDPIVEQCLDNDIPFVLVNRTVDRDGVHAVIGDERAGVRATLEHLISLEHDRIAHVAGPQHTSTGFHRAQAFAEIMKEHQLQSDLVEPTEKFTIEEGRQACSRLLARDSGFTAAVAGNDLLALGCMDVMKDAGIIVPDDISITGYDDMLFLERMSPALTTIKVPKYEMGSQACKTLLDLIGGASLAPSVSEVQPRLVVRASTTTASA